MKLIYEHENMMILHSVKNILEAHDIACFLKNEFGQPMGAEFGLSNTLLELWLNDENDFDKATAIIEKEVLNADSGEAWACAKCGEENAGNFSACWKCQTAQA